MVTVFSDKEQWLSNDSVKNTNVNSWCLLVSDLATLVLKMDVKHQLTN